jgi:hypothetical protein
MSPHLPYAYGDDDEFCHPSGGWYLLDRAITYDSWLTWRHALPGDRQLRNCLPVAVGEAITALALRLDSLHQQLPGYRDLWDCPFVVSRWWDPDAADEDRRSGRCCLLRIEGFSSAQLADAFVAARQEHWSAAPTSGSFLEFRLSKEAPLGEALPSRGAAAPGARPRKRRSPPDQKSGSGLAGPQPAQCSRPLAR